MSGRTVREAQDAMRALCGVGQQAAQKQRRRERLAARQGGICPECELPLPEDLSETEVDHIIPRSRGGPNGAWNKRLLHLKCNRRKSYKLTSEAAALAAAYGITLTEPTKPTYFRNQEGWARRTPEYRAVMAELREAAHSTSLPPDPSERLTP